MTADEVAADADADRRAAKGVSPKDAPQKDAPQKDAPYASWTLRLFQSDFFDSRLAVAYLYRYPDSVGYQYYICEALRDFPDAEVEFLLPQLCHFLATQRSPSFALENFVYNRCCERPHFAALALWIFEAYLVDYAPYPLSREYARLRQLYNTIYALVLMDSAPDGALAPAADGGGLSSAMARWTRLLIYKRKPTFSVRTAAVGAALVAGAAALPAAAARARALVQAELGASPPELAQGIRQAPVGAGGAPGGSMTLLGAMSAVPGGSSAHLGTHRRAPSNATWTVSRRPSSRFPNAPEIAGGGATAPASRLQSPQSPSPTLAAAVQRSLATHAIVSPSLEDLFRGAAFSSGCFVPATTANCGSGDERDPDALARNTEAVPFGAYLRNQMQFVLALFDVCNRLLTVPKAARQSTLVAELSLINYNLPADICLPLWCSAGCRNGRFSGSARRARHHKVVRISPEDAVTLNSADRVPYMIFVEVVDCPPSEDDADADSDGNEADAEASPADKLVLFPRLPADTEGVTVASSDASGLAAPAPAHTSPVIAHAPLSAGARSQLQLQGAFDAGLSAADSDRSSAPSSPSGRGSRVLSPLSPLALHGLNGIGGLGGSAFGAESAAKRPQGDQMGPPGAIELAARMRTAAIMLAQLYRQQEADEQPAGAFSRRPSGVAVSSSAASPSGSAPAPLSTQERVRRKQRYEEIRGRILHEMRVLEEQRQRSAPANAAAAAVADGWLNEREEASLQELCALSSKDDPSASVVQEAWAAKEQRIRRNSPYGRLPGWRLLSVIIKGGVDLRQEQLATQLICECQRIWREAGVPCWVYYYRVLAASSSAGFVETIRDAISVHSLKKDAYARRLNKEGVAFSLHDYFVHKFGAPSSPRFLAAQRCFVESLAAYSVMCHLFQIKDRHNGNILLDASGHLIHIDFGFMLQNSPGSVGFELAPFKLAPDYVDILGGVESPAFREYKSLMLQGWLALRKQHESVVSLVEMMEHDSSLPCFTGQNARAGAAPTAAAATAEAAAAADAARRHRSEAGLLGWFWPAAGGAAGGGGGPAGGTAPPAGRTGAASGATTPAPAPSAAPPADNAGKAVSASAALRERLQLSLSDAQMAAHVDKLVDSAVGSVYTRLYDAFQYYANGIL